METIQTILEQRVSAALSAAAGVPAADAPAIVKASHNPKFGDYQANGVMGLAKKLRQNPRDLALKVIECLEVADMCEPPEVAGPGFINFRLRPDWLAARLGEVLNDAGPTGRLGIDPAPDAPVTVVDFSGPNIAKQMHVGHLRSTIIGDVIARILEFTADNPQKIIRQNHVGDWGLQMGMVIQAIKMAQISQSAQYYGPNDPLQGVTAPEDLNLSLDKFEQYYKEINEILNDEDTARACRENVLKLQQGSDLETRFWKKAREVTLHDCIKQYEELNVILDEGHVRGESFYNDKLPSVLSELSVANLLQESEGAQCVFLPGFKTKEGEPLPLIVQKSDGAYLYATTDLAAIRYRVNDLKAKRIIYVTDARQKLHFQMVFACAAAAGWVDDTINLEHVPFGSVLGPDGSPFKTRSGENVKLKDLLDEAVKRARLVVELKAAEREVDLSEDEKRDIARKVGIGAVKYADLSSNLVSDYVFDWNKMLAMDGNTAPYMQYACARIRSIFRTGEENFDERPTPEKLTLETPEEQDLAKMLLRYGEVIATVAADLRPHLLTLYLFDLAQSFSRFYAQCPVLKSEEPLRTSRLCLCYLTETIIHHGLGLLGIEAPKRM